MTTDDANLTKVNIPVKVFNSSRNCSNHRQENILNREALNTSWR